MFKQNIKIPSNKN